MTFVPRYHIIYLGHISKEVFQLPPKKKMGRPTDNPKRHELKARVDDRTLEILTEYCQKKGKSKAEGIRDGIQKLEADITQK